MAEEEEENSLLPQAEVVQEKSSAVAFPLVYAVVAGLCVLVPLADACSTLLLPCAPPLSKLPSRLPAFTQTAGVISAASGIATTLTFHWLVFKYRDQAPVLKTAFWAGAAAGIAAQVAFAVYGLGWMGTQQSSAAVLYLYEVLSLLHACATLISLYDLRESQVLPPSSPLLFYKSSAVLVLLVCTGFAVLAATAVLRVPRIVNYLVLISHIAYLSSFYFDIRALSARVRCSFGRREIAMLHKVSL